MLLHPGGPRAVPPDAARLGRAQDTLRKAPTGADTGFQGRASGQRPCAPPLTGFSRNRSIPAPAIRCPVGAMRRAEGRP